MPAVWWEATFSNFKSILTAPLGPNVVFTLVSVAAGVMSENKLPVFYAAVEEDCTGGLIREVFDNSDKVGADVVLFHGCPQSCMSNPVEGLLEV